MRNLILLALVIIFVACTMKKSNNKKIMRDCCDEIRFNSMALYSKYAFYEVGANEINDFVLLESPLRIQDIINDKNKYLFLQDSNKLSKINSLLHATRRDTENININTRLVILLHNNFNNFDTLNFFNGYIVKFNRKAKVYNFNLLDSILTICGYSGICTKEARESLKNTYTPDKSILENIVH